MPDRYQGLLGELVDELTASGVEVARPGHLSRREIPDVLRASDIHVVPSRWDEPCPLTVLEGMASGLAVVVTAVGGMPELIGDAGVMVPREDEAALADALVDLVASPARREELGRRARLRAEGLTWTRTWQALVPRPPTSAHPTTP